MTTTFLSCRQKLRAAIGDGHREEVTTALTTTTACWSTNFNKWDGGIDNAFPDWFVYVENHANAGLNRLMSSYATTGGKCTVFAAFSTNDVANLATVMLTKYNPDNYKLAIQRAIRKLHSTLYVPLDNIELITGNIGPNFHFTDWAVTTIPDFFSISSTGTVAEATTIRLTWGGGSSALFTNAAAADEYISIDSDDYPRLLDLMGQRVKFKVWARPSADDDAWIQIYTVQPTSTGTITQTLPATHTAADLEHTADQWTLLELEETLNDNLDKIELRFYIHSAGETCYWDNARITGLGVYEYLLPTDFQNGKITEVYIQTSGMADDACDDIQIRDEEQIWGWDANIWHDIGTTSYRFLRLPAIYTPGHKIHLKGFKPLTVPDSTTDALTDALTVEVDDPQLELLIAQSVVELYRIQQGLISAYDRDMYKREIAEWEWEAQRLRSRFQKARSGTLRFT